MNNPNEAPRPSEETVTRVDISATLENGTWLVSCPQWKYSAPSNNLTRSLALLASEIETHNEGGARAAMERMIVEAPSRAIAILAAEFEIQNEGERRKRRKPMPDDGKCTDRSNTPIWQR